MTILETRAVRKDFNLAKEYSVDVSNCTEEEKEQVQQAFFDVGILWECGANAYQYLEAVQYSNTTEDGDVTECCMYGNTTEECNMTAEEFLNLVYEPENQDKGKGHVHAELMAQYAEDAKTTSLPWELWQVKCAAGIWHRCQQHPKWGRNVEYRRKPKTHFVHGVEIPDLRFTPTSGEYYYLADPTESDFTYHYVFHGDAQDNLWAERGLIYQDTKEGKQAAILHAKAMWD